MKLIWTVLISMLLFSSNTSQSETKAGEKSKKETKATSMSNLEGEWDNFQQIWLENTNTDMHRIETDKKHKHYHLTISKTNNKDGFQMEITEGRNGKKFVEKIILPADAFSSEQVKIDEDTLYVKGMNHFDHLSKPYRFVRVRQFSGWLQYPMEKYKDSTYFQRNLQLHDQGGMAELDIEGVDYTVELTQLIYGKKIKLMKIAIYDMPLDSVGINSKSISYAWTSPEATRLGINLRKIVSGWTLIEPDYVNSNTMKKKE